MKTHEHTNNKKMTCKFRPFGASCFASWKCETHLTIQTPMNLLGSILGKIEDRLHPSWGVRYFLITYLENPGMSVDRIPIKIPSELPWKNYPDLPCQERFFYSCRGFFFHSSKLTFQLRWLFFPISFQTGLLQVSSFLRVAAFVPPGCP